jgi:hypothetical protein
MPDKRTASQPRLRRASSGLRKALRSLPLDDAYVTVCAHLHTIFDQLPPRAVDMLLIFLVTHAWESREARAQGRPANFSTLHQLMHWADVRRDGTNVHVGVSLNITMTEADWEQAHEAGVALTPDAPWHHQP